MLYPVSLKDTGVYAAWFIMGPQFLLAVVIAMKQGVPSELNVCW